LRRIAPRHLLAVGRLQRGRARPVAPAAEEQQVAAGADERRAGAWRWSRVSGAHLLPHPAAEAVLVACVAQKGGAEVAAAEEVDAAVGGDAERGRDEVLDVVG